MIEDRRVLKFFFLGTNFDRCHRKHHASNCLTNPFCFLVGRPVTGCKAVIGMAHDVTEQVQQREILAQSEQRHQALFDLAGVGTLTLALENHCITSCRYKEISYDGNSCM